MRSDNARWRQDSITLNQVGWRIAEALGDIPEGGTHHEADILEDLERLIALVKEV